MRVKGLPLRGLAAVFGGFLLQFTMGAFYSFGNMSTYMTSYMRQNGSPHVTYTGEMYLQPLKYRSPEPIIKNEETYLSTYTF